MRMAAGSPIWISTSSTNITPGKGAFVWIGLHEPDEEVLAKVQQPLRPP